MEKLHIFAVDDQFNRASGMIEYESLTWSRRYHEPGEFSLTVSRDVYDPSWAYICTDNRPETGIIQARTIADDDYSSEMSAGPDTITLSGMFLEARLNNFVFLVEQTGTEDRYEAPPSLSPIPQRRDAWQSDGGFVYTYDREGNLSGYDPVNHVRKPLKGVAPNDDGSITVTDFDDAVYTVAKIPENKVYVSRGEYWYFEGEGGDKTLKADIIGWKGGINPDLDLEYTKWVTDDYGDTWTRNVGGDGTINWNRTTGVKTKAHDTYEYQMRSWRSRTNNGWYTVKVKGPWQRTDIGDPEKKTDPAQHVTQWVQMFFGNSLTYVEPGFTCEPRVIDPSLRRLGDLAYEELRPEGASFRLVYDFEQNEFVFEAYRGLDRTQDQSENPWATFSDSWGTLYGYRFTEDRSNYRNTCYVLYDYDEPTQWDGNVPALVPVTDGYGAVVGYKVPYQRKQGFVKARIKDGFEDMEIFLDLRSEKPEPDGEWSREMYRAADKPTFEGDMKSAYDSFGDFEGRGLTELKNNYAAIENMDTGVLDYETYIESWDMGDLVDVVVTGVGKSYKARITGVDEQYSADDASVSVIIGEELLTSDKKARLL